MESFLNRVEREANLEVKRIRGEAQQIVDVLKALGLEVPQELQHIVSSVKPPETIREAAEKEKPKQDHSERITRVKAKAEAEYQQTRAEIYGVLSKGPKLGDEVVKLIPRSAYSIRKAATRMKKDGELDFRTRGFQGSTEWFLIERPVTLEQLRDEVVDRKGGDIPFVQTQEKLGFQNPEHLAKMLDELVAQDIIRQEDGIYATYATHSTAGTRTLYEKKRYSAGNGVAGTGRSKVSSSHEVNSYLNKIQSQGAKVKPTSGDHIAIEYNGKTATVGKTPSRSGLLQDKNRVKSLGLNV